MRLKEASTDSFEHIFSEIEKNFIPDERRDYDKARAVMDLAEYSVYLAFDEELEVGFITVWKLSDFVFAEHFVIYERYRNRGYGSKVLSLLKEFFPAIILEVEHPTDSLKRRRLEFYRRCGFIQNDFSYIQPPYRENGSGVPLILMSYPEKISTADDTVAKIYKSVYRKQN